MTWIDKTEAAKRLGIHHNSMYEFWRRYNIKSEKQARIAGNGKTYHPRVYWKPDIERVLAEGYDATKAKRRAAKMAVTENHPYKNLAKVDGARATLTPLQRAKANLYARKRIEKNVRVREIPETDLSWLTNRPFITPRDAAGLANVDESTIRRWCDRGHIAHQRDGDRYVINAISFKQMLSAWSVKE